jgi:toxin ParE1/3/4
MPRFRLSFAARRDLSRLLAASEESWGREARDRYAALLVAAMQQVALEPQGRTTRDRAHLAPGLRSFHLRHTRIASQGAAVQHPVHVLYYRALLPDAVEIVRVLHERMEPSRQLELEC